MAVDLVLASESPRRIAYLKQLDIRFNAIASHLHEQLDETLSPQAMVEDLAKQKALAVFQREHWVNQAEAKPILAADTLVFLDGRPKGKPTDLQDAMDTLTELSGRTHEVITAMAMLLPTHDLQAPAWRIRASITRVTFSKLTQHQIQAYCATGEPMGKAGAYAIQGVGQALVSHIQGCYATVVGLPLAQLIELLDEVGVPHVFSAKPLALSSGQ